MKIFGKNRDSLRIKKLRASRAVFVNTDVQEVELSLMTDDNERLDLQIPDRLLGPLIQQLTISYNAIHPPINSQGSYQATWQGMDNN